MMSNILGKTINSVFVPSDTFLGLQGVFKQVTEAKTKKEEAMIIQRYLAILREKLKDPGMRPNFVGHCMAFIVFCDILGYPAQFAHIHAINLAQQNSLPEKKMGYAASCYLLKEGDELCLLLVNTLIRDLGSSNVALIALALSALCSAPLPAEVTPAVLPSLRDHLTHQTAYIRSRAVVTAHHLLKRHPAQSSHILSNVVARLGDEDPHVVARVLTTLSDIMQLSPESVSGLVCPLVAIQRQILKGKLPSEMNYLNIPAPWMQLNIIKVLPELALSEEDESAAKEVLLETLSQYAVKDGSLFEPPIRAALVSQSLAALMSLEGPSESCKARAMLHIGNMLSATSSDIKHEGLQLLGLVLSKHETTLTPEQKDAVNSSLDHPDITVRRRALALLAAGAGPSDVQIVCGQLFSQASSADLQLKVWLLEQALALTEKYANAVSLDWRLSALVKMMPLADGSLMLQNIMKTCQSLLMSDELKSETRVKLLGLLSKHAEAKEAPTCLLILYVWTLGNFPDLCQTEGENALTRLVTLGTKILQNSKEESVNLLLQIVNACVKAITSPSIQPTDELMQFLKQVKEVNTELESAASELEHSLPLLNRMRKCLLSKEPLPELDCMLSAMDKFVVDSLKNKRCKPYQPLLAASVLQPRTRTPVASAQEFVRNPSPHAASVVSEDSWSVRSITSPIEVISPEIPVKKLVWGRKGRISSSPENASTTATSISLALTGNTQVTHNSGGATIITDDPLGDLLR